MRKHISFFFIFLVIIASLLVLYYRIENVYKEEALRSEKENAGQKVNLISTLLRNKYIYFNVYNKGNSLLSFYENKSHILEIKNISETNIRFNNPSIFYDIDKIKSEISIIGDESPSQKAEKIFNFMKKRYRTSVPLYENKTLHNPPHFFSVYGSGFCDDAACNMAFLASLYDFEARTWWLSGHVVADIKYDNRWHIYDPNKLGIVYYDNEVATIEDMVSLAKQDKLEYYNEEYRTTENNISDYEIFLPIEPNNPFMDILPEERKYFYAEIFMLTTDGHYLRDRLKNKKKFYQEYSPVMANFIREIPLNENTVHDGDITLNDYFPFAGVFICIAGSDIKLSPDLMPQIYMNSYFLQTGEWISPQKHMAENLNNTYLNLSFGIKNLEPYPSHLIKISNLRGLMRHFKDIKLLTVHYYSYLNAQFDNESLSKLQRPGISVTYKKQIIK